MAQMSPSIRALLNEYDAERDYKMESSPEVFQMLQDYQNAHKKIAHLQEEREIMKEKIEVIEAHIKNQVTFIDEVDNRFPKLIGEIEFISKLDDLELPDGRGSRYLGIFT